MHFILISSVQMFTVCCLNLCFNFNTQRLVFLGPVGIPNGMDGVYRMDPGTQLSLDIISGNRKRRHTDNDESDEEGAENSISAPVNDIYRSRQQKKVK